MKTSNALTEREEAICILSTLKGNPEEASVLCGVMGISKEVVAQATLDIHRFADKATEAIIHEQNR